jgi:hypothetical protein
MAWDRPVSWWRECVRPWSRPARKSVQNCRPRFDVLEDRRVPSTLTNLQRLANPFSTFFAVAGAPGHVQIRNITDGSLRYDFQPYGPFYTGGISVAVGDVNRDGFDDLITGTLDNFDSVKIFSGIPLANGTFTPSNPDGSLIIPAFNPFGAQFGIGVNVAAGNISNNGFADVVCGAAAGNPDVRVYKGQDIANHVFNPTLGASMLAQFFPYALGFNIGANVAAGDVSNDGFADLVTGPTAGNPDVRVYNGQDIALRLFNPNGISLLTQFFAYGLQFNVGAYVAVGDVNADGFADVITGATSGNPDVHVYDGKAIAHHAFNVQGSLLTSFFAFELNQGIGVTVASAYFLEGDGTFDILVGNNLTMPHYRLVRGTAIGINPPSIKGIDGMALTVQGGVFVGA